MESTSSKLLDDARRNDQQAWRHVVEEYGPLVRGLCRRAGLSELHTDDVLQEVLLAVYNALANFSRLYGRGSFRSWLRRITENKIHDHYRRERQQALVSASAMELLPQEDDREVTKDKDQLVPTLKSTADLHELLDSIRTEFSEQTWRAFALVTFRNFTSKEAADELQITANAVRLANGRVRRRLKRKLPRILHPSKRLRLASVSSFER